MLCYEKHVTFVDKQCNFPPYITDGELALCKFHAMDKTVNHLWKNKIQVRQSREEAC